MQYHWLRGKCTVSGKCNNLVIFFAGWSFDYLPFEFLECEDLDVLVIYDYNDISADIFEELHQEFAKYKNIDLIGWSMGVYVAEILKDKLPKLNRKIAVNGTLKPVDNEYGIPLKPFALTLKFAQAGLEGKFYQNIFHEVENYERYCKTPVQRTIENRVSELYNLNDYILKNDNEIDKNFYDAAIVSKFDKIIPPKNQLNFWEALGCDIIELETGHFPFYQFKNWNEIIDAGKSPISKETV